MRGSSSSSSTSCFDLAIDYLNSYYSYELDGNCRSAIENLKTGIGLLNTFDLYIGNGKCKRRRSNQGICLEFDNLRLRAISFGILDLVEQSIYGLHSAVFEYFQPGAWNISYLRCELAEFEKNMRLFFETTIKELDIISLLFSYSLEDLELVMDFVESISSSLASVLRPEHNKYDEPLFMVMETLQEKLMLLKSFVRFATVQGLEGQPLRDLLDHIEIVAVNAASLTSTSWFQRKSKEVCNEMVSEISQLIYKMVDPISPQVREIYTHVLKASKLSRSSDALAMKENRHLVLKFIDYLLRSIRGVISECYACYMVTVKDQMLKLIEGVRFLTILLSLQQEKFDELNNEIKDCIGVVVSDVGIVAFSLSVNEMKDGLCRDTELALSNLLQVLNLIIAEVAHICPLTLSSSSSSLLSFPWTNELGSLDFLLETLKEVVSSTSDSTSFPNDKVLPILEGLVFLRSFLGNIVEQRNRDEKLQAFWSRVMKVAYGAELEIDCALLGDKHERCLDAIAEEIHLLKIEAEVIHDSIRYDGETQRVTKTTINMSSQVTAPISNEALVGLSDEVASIIDRLVRGSKQLDIIAIVGMPGLGKTTLANKVYGDPSIKFHFHIHAWCCVSQAYNKHSLLFQILCCIDCGRSNQYQKMNEDDMADVLRKFLKRNRYLIILDDVWDIDWWDFLKHSLPDDCNGSRILLTSRFQKLGGQIKPNSEPHHLRPLTVSESCELLQKKLFAKEDCPPTLSEVVLHVANYCKGLPLAVVLVAGILAATMQDYWEEVVRRLTSNIYIDNEHCMKTLEQSYNYLPDILKPCLLYFGAFQEDQDIPVRKMLWLWISEGFVQQTKGMSLEDVAYNYLMDLIGRSLVVATQQRSLGGVKACRVHDLVHEFCVAKAKEESFLQVLRVDELSAFTRPCNPDRISIHPTLTMNMGLVESRLFFPHLHSLLLFGDSHNKLDPNSFKFLLSKLLRVLDMCANPPLFLVGGNFPREVIFLVHLRYLRIGIFIGDIPTAIANLSRLETFAVAERDENYLLPNTIWNIKTLRHLVTYSFNKQQASHNGFIFPMDNLEGSPDLKHLDTLTLALHPPSQNKQKMLSKLPSIRNLRIVHERYQASASAINDDGILVLSQLSKLESLTIRSFHGYEFEFPLNLKKLTLSGNRQPWSKISTIGKLPNLAVLKLCHDSFSGEKWVMEEGEFCNLRFLRLSMLNIRYWTASFDNFCCLEKLVLKGCRELEEVPSCLGESPTLDMIEVKWCSESTVNYVEQIQQEQIDLGNKSLKIVIIKEEDGEIYSDREPYSYEDFYTFHESFVLSFGSSGEEA